MRCFDGIQDAIVADRRILHGVLKELFQYGCFSGQTHQRTGRASELERGGQRVRYGEPTLRAEVVRGLSQGALIDVPTLSIHGGADRIVPIKAAGEKTAKLVKGAQLTTIRDGAHLQIGRTPTK